MPSSYDTSVVAASLAIAWLTSFVTLNLAGRIQRSHRRVRLTWWAAGSIVMGTGIWSMHFLGMQAFHLPIVIGYGGGLTLLSWVAAVSASGLALGLASRETFDRRDQMLGALSMGAGISGMHYIGMAAMGMEPGITWDFWIVALSVLIAVLASASALVIFRLLSKVKRSRRLVYQLAGSFVMACAICGMHYTGMAAAGFSWGAVCGSAGSLGGTSLTAMVLIATGMLLVSALLMSILDARLRSTAQGLSRSLQESNDRLQDANEELKHRAFADPLTGLPNRLLFEDRLEHALVRLDRLGREGVTERIGILFLDLDGFKPVNDSFGHATGDKILRSVGERLVREARESDTVARVGGDEFLFLLENIADVAVCTTVAGRVIATLSRPFEVLGKQVEIACSIGIVIYPGPGERTKLVANADAAMYAAKRLGGNRYAVFESHMDTQASDQLELRNDLGHALNEGNSLCTTSQR